METSLKPSPLITDDGSGPSSHQEDTEAHEEVYSITEEGRELLSRLTGLLEDED